MGVVLAVFLGSSLAGLIVLAVLLTRERQAAQRAREEGKAIADRAAHLEQQLAVLKKYETIVDVEAAAARTRDESAAEAKETMDRANMAAAGIVENAQQQAAALASEAQQKLDAGRATLAETQASLSAASAEAKRLEQVAQAVRNVIEGYGDRYVLPTSGLLDELADEFSFTDAGQNLKAARAHTRQMIETYRAADCDYVEANRRSTAIEFVLDAFNGKVDTILSSVRHDNFGTLRQKVLDAFQLVNQNGRAFRNARILPDYLGARLEELRWAVAAQELKLREREEQRALKERIREEERAQREFEQAIKEAEKEEEGLRKAMDKARREIAKASEEQKARYEQQLQERLRNACESRRRRPNGQSRWRSRLAAVMSM
jgi:hypothetical protein